MAKKNKAKYDSQIKQNYPQYRANLDSDKTIAGALDVSTVKKFRSNFYSGTIDVAAAVPFGNTSVECMIKRNDEYHYSIAYHSDAIESRLLTRLDAGIGTHFNRAPGIPQHLTSVPMPHYHEYREDGYDVAHRIPDVDYSNESSTKFDYVKGFLYFSNKLHIKEASGGDVKIECSPIGVLPLDIESDIDPNNNVYFPE